MAGGGGGVGIMLTSGNGSITSQYQYGREEGWEAGARNEKEEDVAVTRAVCNRAGNEPSRKMKFHNHGEGLYYASTRAFSWLKALTSASTNEILC